MSDIARAKRANSFNIFVAHNGYIVQPTNINRQFIEGPQTHVFESFNGMVEFLGENLEFPSTHPDPDQPELPGLEELSEAKPHGICVGARL